MATKKPISWFLTGEGRRFSFVVVTATGVGFTFAKFTPHTILLYKYKDFVHYYQNGKPAELPGSILARFHKCLDDLKISEIHRKLLSPFSAFGYDLFHAGSTSSRFGAAVGIPVNFMYNSVADVDKHNIQVNQKQVDINTETGLKLANALVLPEKVQKFAMCREILMTQNNKIMYESAYPFICTFFTFNLSQYINKRLNLYAAPLTVRATLYSIIGLFGLGSYFLMKDMTEVYYETKVDKKLVELGPEYVESGVVFYNKILERNQALRELMGNEGEKKYSKLGNENFLLRQPRLALVHRKQYFEERYKELKGNQENIDS